MDTSTMLFIDFETYYDKEFSLSKLRTDQYIYDPRFEIIMVGVIVQYRGKTKSMVFEGTPDEIKHKLLSVGADRLPVCGHNMHFDGFILSEVLGIDPPFIYDTLSMARAALPHLASHSLANLAKHFELQDKGTEVVSALGKRRKDFSPVEFDRYVEYCLLDGWLTREIFHKLLPLIPKPELHIIDMTVKMFTQPAFVVDEQMAFNYWTGEVNRKTNLLAELGLTATDLRSNDRFARLLADECDIEPPTKISPKTGKRAYAFAKTDEAMQNLLENENPKVRALVAARLGVKSSIAETRALHFYTMSRDGRGLFPVYLNYWGAKTTGRWSGGNKVNAQNFPNRGEDRVLRYALKAPPGYKVVVGDSSNIELRVAMALAGQEDALADLRSGVDLYCEFASTVFGRPITKADDRERFLGKTAMLFLQYGAGATKYMESLRNMGTRVTLDTAHDITQKYRSRYHKIVKLWKHLDHRVLPSITAGQHWLKVDEADWFLTTNDGLVIPGTLGITYKNLKLVGEEWSYASGRGRVKLYGGKVMENISQHAARHIVALQALRVHARYPVKLLVHDEIVCVVPEDQAEDCAAYMLESLSVAPKFCDGKIPLKGEVGIGDSYGEAK
jgi:DNA polymerase I-like protein with 3'-5' exonuclease and polymerase domains